MEVNDAVLALYIDSQAAYLEQRLAREPVSQRATLIQNELLLMLSDWKGDDTKFRHHLAQYGITSDMEVRAFMERGLEVLYQMMYASLEGKKGARSIREVYRSMGYDEASMNLLTLLLVELILREPAEDVPLIPPTAQQAQDIAGKFVRDYLARQGKPLPEQM